MHMSHSTNKLKVISMNINGLGDKLRYPGNMEYLMEYDIILISESWLRERSNPADYQIPWFKEFNIYRKHLHVNALRASGGILVYIRKRYLSNIKIVQELCDHFVVLEVKDNDNTLMYIIDCYIPPSDTTFVCKTCDNNYYCSLTDLVVHYSAKGPVSVCGDLNAHTAEVNENITYEQNSSDLVEPSVWNLDLPHRTSEDKRPLNDYGTELISLCIASGLRIANGPCYADKAIGKATFIRGECRSVLDYLPLQESIYPLLSGFSIGDKWPESDHCPVMFEFTLPCGVKKVPRSDSPKERYDTYTRFFYDETSKDGFKLCLSDEYGSAALSDFYNGVFSLESSNQLCEYFDTYILQACERSLGSSGKPKKLFKLS